MADMPWKEAIIVVLEDAGEALNYVVIAERVAERRLRRKLGATPSNSVNVTLTQSIKVEGDLSPFRRVAPGMYELQSLKQARTGASEPESSRPALISAFGMFWERDLVRWKARPSILGRESKMAEAVDMADQIGIYLLHDFREVVYVGRVSEGQLGKRLNDHTSGRLKTRWNRFSWFGLRPVTEAGQLGAVSGSHEVAGIVTTMEALLIEALEPRQNRRGGDHFAGIEFIQTEDPELQRERSEEHIARLLRDR